MAVGDAYSAFMATWNKHASRAACRLPSLAKLAACGRKRIGAGGEGLLLRLVPCLGNRGNNSSNQNKKKKMKMMMRKVRSQISVEGEDEGVWRKTILMGEKCQPLDFSGAVHYDSAGRQRSRLWEEKKRLLLDLTYGSAFNLRRDLDAQILSRFQRPPGALTSSMLGFEVLTGGLDDFAFEDYLNLPQDSESIRPSDLHHAMEVRLGVSKGPVFPSFIGRGGKRGLDSRGSSRWQCRVGCPTSLLLAAPRPSPFYGESMPAGWAPSLVLAPSPPCHRCVVLDHDKAIRDAVGRKRKRNQRTSFWVNSILEYLVLQSSCCQYVYVIASSKLENEFFTEYSEGSRYHVQEVIGKGSYGVVGAAIDTHSGERVAIKKINDVFEHVSDATRILREIKLLRLLRHPDIVEIKHIMLPPSRREFRDIYVVFELMESDLHQVIKANDDLTPEHHQFFLYQLLRALKYIHAANVFHRDLKPKNILANADCKLKVCDFGLARVAFNDAPSAIFWTDYVATRCCICLDKVQYTPAIDIWSIGCIFAEMLTGRPLFPGKNVVHQLDLMTDLLGTPSAESIAKIRNEKAKRYLSNMRKKQPISFHQKFPCVDSLALRLLERLLAFDPKDRPTAEEALNDPYFRGLANVEREPSTQPISKLEFEFERRKLTKDDVRELIYREILEYHPQMLQEYLRGGNQINFMYPSGVDLFKRQFAHLEEHYGNKGDKNAALRQHASLPRERVGGNKDRSADDNNEYEGRSVESVARSTLESPPGSQHGERSDHSSIADVNRSKIGARSLLKSESISASKCVVVKQRKDKELDAKDIAKIILTKDNYEEIGEVTEDSVDGLDSKFSHLHS
ncbi:hypothetical protein ZIOFF_059099 [Zingiber officinale]|uniref:mitogen-activated protein kinase n=1 Tax=Zingiber officinale TaxID=94328 RepID=A0A8J5FAR1_ZINOF|nr:hypothetical protein ZIOFF_059099 [Zingiber officinale]